MTGISLEPPVSYRPCSTWDNTYPDHFHSMPSTDSSKVHIEITMVIGVFSSTQYTHIEPLFHTDTQHTQSLLESNRR